MSRTFPILGDEPHKLMGAYLMAGGSGLLLEALTKVPVAVWILMALMVLDIASGLVVAVIQHNVNRERSWQGLLRKCMILMLVAASALVAHLIDGGHPLIQHLDLPLTSVTAGMFCLYELISICENTARAGVTVPAPLRMALERFRASEDQQKRSALPEEEGL